MSLIVVESSSKCLKIEELLDHKYQCVACFGHIREIDSLTNIYECKYKNIKKNIDKLRKSISSAHEVILATDDDREGESIAWHLCQVFSLNPKTTKRIVFNEITRDALTKAILHPTTINMDIVEAQTARMVLDRIVGFKISPVLWKNINRSGKLSAGRCQTPALRLVYDNYIDLKKTKHNYIFKTTTSVMNSVFELKKHMTEEDDVKQFLQDSIAFQHNLSRKEEKSMCKNPPIPFITSTLQQSASNNYNIAPKSLMIIAQKLYQSGKITYMRTDNPNLSIECSEKIKRYVTNRFGTTYLGECRYTHKSKKYAHECIRPTNIDLTTLGSSFSPQERNIYSMIWKRTIQSCMSQASGLTYECRISSPGDSYYFHKFEKITFPGFMALQETVPTTMYDTFMNITLGVIALNTIKSENSITNLKSHYTEAKLVRLLESHGIGRPSTYAMLLDKLKTKGYVEKTHLPGFPIECTDFTLTKKKIETTNQTKMFGSEKNKLVITDLGVIVIEFCLSHFQSLFEYDYTRQMEEQLDIIANGKDDRKKICTQTHNDIEQLVKKIVKKEHTEIEENHFYIVGKYGPCIKVTGGAKDKFLSIKKGITLDMIRTKNLTVKDIIENNVIGDYDGETLYLMKGKYGPFTKYNEKTYSLKNIPITLPNVIREIERQKSLIISKDISIKKGKYGHYVYYKTEQMTKPLFLGLKKYKLTLRSTHEEIEAAIEKYYEDN